MKKRLISFFMVCCMLLSVFSVTAVAAQVAPEISPQWSNTSGITMYLSFNGTTGYFSLTITGQPGVSNITADVQLYYKNTSGNWIAMPQHWTYDVDQMILIGNETFTAVRGREYKAVMTGVVTKNGYKESVDHTAIDTCPTSP